MTRYRWNARKCLHNLGGLAFRIAVVLLFIAIVGFNPMHII